MESKIMISNHICCQLCIFFKYQWLAILYVTSTYFSLFDQRKRKIENTPTCNYIIFYDLVVKSSKFFLKMCFQRIKRFENIMCIVHCTLYIFDQKDVLCRWKICVYACYKFILCFLCKEKIVSLKFVQIIPRAIF